MQRKVSKRGLLLSRDKLLYRANMKSNYRPSNEPSLSEIEFPTHTGQAEGDTPRLFHLTAMALGLPSILTLNVAAFDVNAGRCCLSSARRNVNNLPVSSSIISTHEGPDKGCG